MQNVQRWGENVMMYDGFDDRMVMGRGFSESEKMMEYKETEVENCRTAELTNRQDAEDRQLDGLTKRGRRPEGRELAADDRWLERPERQ